MRRCDVCNELIPLGASVCPNCGQKLKKGSSQTQEDHPKKSNVLLIMMMFFAFIMVIGIMMLNAFNTRLPETPSESSYVALDSYELLVDEYKEIASEVQPYRNYTVEFLDEYNDHGEEALYEKYTLVNNELISATLSGNVADGFFGEHTMLYIKKDINSDDWILQIDDYYLWETSLFYDSFGEGPIRHISDMMHLDTEKLVTKYMELTIRDSLYTGKEIQTECGNGSFTMRFEGDRMTYQYVEPVDLK